MADNVPLDGIVLHGSAVGAALTYGNNNTITIIYGSEGLGRAVSELSHRAPPELGEIGPNPYRGLNAFDEASSHLFFGREELTGNLVKKLRELWRQSGQRVRLLAIMGPSGCGKSSVARAGIVPRLAKGDVSGLENATVAILQPGPHPAEALALALARLATGNPTPAAKAREFGDELALPGVDGQLDGLSRLARMLCPSNKPLIILFDQFEEAWTLCQPADPKDAGAAKRTSAERFTFVRTLMHAAAEPNGRVIVLLTLRSDFFGVTAEFPEMNRAIATGHEIVPVMSQDELRAAIAEPARVAGRPLAEAAVSRMLGEVEGEDSSLPLLQFALHQIWEGFRQARSENDTLDALQGVGGALAFRAEELLQDVLDERGRRLVRRAFEEMVQLGEGVRDTRRRVRLSDMVPHGATEADLTEALEPFVAERLVSKGSDEEGQITAELAHEALIQHWQTLRRWIDDRRADLRFGRRVQQAATEWWDSGRLVGRLWRPPDLDRLRDFARRSPQNLTEQGAEFLRRSERGRKQQQWIRRSVVGAITVLFFVATAFGFYSQHEARVAESATVEATEQKNQAREAADRAQRATADAKEQRNLAEEQNTRAQEQRTQALLQESQAVSILSRQATARGDPMTGMLSALEVLPDPAIGRVRPVSNAASSALLDAWLHNRELADLLGHTGFVSSAAFSPDGQRVVTASDDHTARVWDLSGPRPVATVLEGHTDVVSSAAFSPDGKRVVTASGDHTARVWDLSGPRPVATVLEGHTDAVSNAAFSPDGKRVVIASRDHTARVWDLSGPRPVATVLEGHTNAVWSAAFSPDGKRVVTASSDHTARVWDLSGPRPVATVLEGHTDIVSSATFSPDGKRVVTASKDYTARVWDLSGPRPVATVLEGHTSIVSSAAFSPDGKRVVTASFDHTARVWDLSEPRPVATVLEGHTDVVLSAAFSSDGKRVVTASDDRTARVWDLSGPRPVATELEGHTSIVSSAAFSPDGKRVVTASFDHTARVWDLSGPRPVATALEGHTDVVLSAAFSPDGKRVVTASEDSTARVWDLSGPRPVATELEGHTDVVSSAAFSPDGKRVVTASWDSTARVVPVPSMDILVKEATRSLTRCLTVAQREELGFSASLFTLVDHEVDRYEVTAPPCI